MDKQEAAHLFLLEDNLVEQVLKVLVGIVDAELLEAVEAQVLPGRWEARSGSPWSTTHRSPIMALCTFSRPKPRPLHFMAVVLKKSWTLAPDPVRPSAHQMGPIEEPEAQATRPSAWVPVLALPLSDCV